MPQWSVFHTWSHGPFGSQGARGMVGAVEGVDSGVLIANCDVLQIPCTGEVDFCTKNFQQWGWRLKIIQA